ncbi:hypothetical protein J6590_106239 [Homalodisca vitripennis]|nr:hypothetical protein J6590_106239 [Homalodisca vitripennis]
MAHRHKITQLEFKRAIAVHYLKVYGTEPQVGGRPAWRPQSTPAFEELRFDGLNHFVIQNKGNKKSRCAGSECKSIMRTVCSK